MVLNLLQFKYMKKVKKVNPSKIIKRKVKEKKEEEPMTPEEFDEAIGWDVDSYFEKM